MPVAGGREFAGAGGTRAVVDDDGAAGAERETKRVQEAGALKVVVKIDGTVEQLMNVWQHLFVGFVEREDDVVIEVDEGNAMLR